MQLLRFSLLLYFGFPVLAWAGAWTLPEGSTQAITTISYSFASDKFDADGRAIAAKPLEKAELRSFVEYGLTDWATLMIQPEWRWKSVDDRDVNGLGRVDLGLRARIWRDDTSVVSLQGTARIPGASDELEPLNGGDTEWELDARALYGRGFPIVGRHSFVNIEAGYRHRFGDPPDELRADLTFGIDVTPKVLWLAQSFNAVSIGGAKGTFAQNQEHKLAFSSAYRFSERWAVQAGAFSTVHGRNVSRERGGFLALWARF